MGQTSLSIIRHWSGMTGIINQSHPEDVTLGKTDLEYSRHLHESAFSLSAVQLY